MTQVKFTLDKLSSYSPSFASSGVSNEDADTVLERIISEPCGTDAVTFSEKSGNTRALSFAAAGKGIVSAISSAENKKRKLDAFYKRFPKDAGLVGYDDEVDARFKDFNEYTKTNDVRETVLILNCEKGIPLEIRNKAAKNVATIGNYTGLLTDDVADKFAQASFNYFLQKNPVFHATVLANTDHYSEKNESESATKSEQD